MDGHLNLIWGWPEWKEGIVSYCKGLIEFVCQRLIEGRKDSSWSVKVGRLKVSEPQGLTDAVNPRGKGQLACLRTEAAISGAVAAMRRGS